MEVYNEGRRRVLPVIFSVGALAFSGVVAGCGDSSEGPETAGGGDNPVAESQPREAPSEVTFEEVLSNTEAYVGQQVTVSAGVDEVVVAPGAFTLGGELDDDELYVLPTTEAEVPSEDIDEDTTVRVQGRVEMVDTELFDDEDFLFEDDDAFDADRFDGSPAVVASQIEVIEDPQ